jgi:ribosomal protein L37E
MAEGMCAGCGEEKFLKAKGYCRACYQQWKRTGSVVRERMPRGQCTVEGCEKKAHGRGLCDMHIRRLKVSGTFDDPRADNFSLKSNSSVYQIWQGYRKPGAPPMHPAWFDNPLAFEDGVGKKPSVDHRLYRIDKTKPMEPGNFEWRKKLDIRRRNEETPEEYNDRYRKARKEAVGHSMWGSDLRRKYGIDDARHQAMYEAQKGLCAISGRPEDRTRGTGGAVYLATDHTDRPDGTKLVRQMLRGACNTAIGLMEHDPFMLAKAILYLAKHDPDGHHAGQQKVNAAIAYLQSWPVVDLDQDAILPQDVKGTTNAN